MADRFSFSRRDLMAAAAAVGGVASLGAPRAAEASAGAPVSLTTCRRDVQVYGKTARRFSVVQPNGTFGLTLEAGQEFNVDLSNGMDVPTSVHWHGMVEPWRQDGVPWLSAEPLLPGEKRPFRFPAKPTGTRWMHSHFGLQEQNLLAAPLIIRDAAAAALDAQEVVVMLDDFTWRKPTQVLADLRKPKKGMSDSGPDLNDVTYDAFLANGRTLEDPDVVAVEKGGRVRLRIINASASTNFHIDLGALHATLLAVDGDPVEPLQGSSFPIAVAQRLDLLLTLPSNGMAVPVLAAAEGRRLRAGVILRPPGAAAPKLPVSVDSAAPRVTLELEKRLRATEPLADRTADRTIPVSLDGSMVDYLWLMGAHGLPGLVASAKAGNRVEITMTNKTAMAHPMHLHGHVFQVVAIDGERFPGAMRDTVLVLPKTSVTIAFDADNPGLWAFHCHNLYHLATGMFATFAYRDGL